MSHTSAVAAVALGLLAAVPALGRVVPVAGPVAATASNHCSAGGSAY